MQDKVIGLTRRQQKERHRAMFDFFKKNLNDFEEQEMTRDEIYEVIREKFGFAHLQSVRQQITKMIREENKSSSDA